MTLLIKEVIIDCFHMTQFYKVTWSVIFNRNFIILIDKYLNCFRFEVSVVPQAGIGLEGGQTAENSGEQQEGNKSKVGLIIGIILALVVVIVLIAGLTFYSKKNHILCFRSESVYRTHEKDPNLEIPLQNVDPQERPIIKPGSRPPEIRIWETFTLLPLIA